MNDRNGDVRERLRAARAAFVPQVGRAFGDGEGVTDAIRGKGEGAADSGPDNGKEPEQWAIDEARNGRR